MAGSTSTVVGAAADEVLGLATRGAGSVLRVAVEGVDGAGKARSADEMAERLTRRGRQAIRARPHRPHRTDPTGAANHRYVAGQQIYLAGCRPHDRATEVRAPTIHRQAT